MLKITPVDASTPEIDFDHLSKDRRDWLEIFGNQWGGGLSPAKPLTPEEREEARRPIFPVFLRARE